jgi:hypothetical protein
LAVAQLLVRVRLFDGPGVVSTETGKPCPEPDVYTDLRPESARARVRSARGRLAGPCFSIRWTDKRGPANVMKSVVRVRASSDPRCEVGTVGHAPLFASYNGVRSDSVQFFFPAAYRD